MFLGVLTNDILGVDLSQVDPHPRKLSRGEWNECVYIGGLLVHVAKREGFMVDEAIVEVDPEVSVSDVLEEEAVSEGLPRALPLSTTRAGITTAVGEDRSSNGGRVTTVLAGSTWCSDKHPTSSEDWNTWIVAYKPVVRGLLAILHVSTRYLLDVHLWEALNMFVSPLVAP